MIDLSEMKDLAISLTGMGDKAVSAWVFRQYFEMAIQGLLFSGVFFSGIMAAIGYWYSSKNENYSIERLRRENEELSENIEQYKVIISSRAIR